MYRFDRSTSNSDNPLLLNAVSALQELLSDVKDLPGVANLLTKILEAQAVTFSVVGVSPSGAPEIIVDSTCNGYPGDTAAATSPVQNATGLSLTHAAYNPYAGAIFRIDPAPAESEVRQLSFSRQIDPVYVMNITVRQQGEGALTDSGSDGLLEILGNHVARGLRILLNAAAYPPVIAEPFTRLTKQEWTILFGMNSDDGEKQLADKMNLSLHTLHSHIKSIYRKTGVQGRLSLLLNFRHAMQEFRLRAMVQSMDNPQPAVRRAAG